MRPRKSGLWLSFQNQTGLRAGLLLQCVAVLPIVVSTTFAQQPAQEPRPCQEPKPKVHAQKPCPVCPSCTENGGATAFVVQAPAATSPAEEKLKALVPLLQSALWVVLIAAGLIGFRKEVAGLLNRAKSVEIGGVKIDTEPEGEEPLSTAVPEDVPVRVRFS